MKVEHQPNSIPITASEVSYLWNTYLLNSKSKHILMYGVAKSDDKDIREVMQQAMDLSAMSLSKVKELFDAEKQPVPYGFSESDVVQNAQKIYSDKLMIYILRVYTMVGLSNYGMAISASPRYDIRSFFTDSMKTTIDLSNKLDDIALEKGFYIKTPHIPPTKTAELAADKSIMGKIIGHKRPLTALEISAVFISSMTASIAEAGIIGLAQTVQEERLKDFMNRTRKTLKEQSESMNEILHQEELTFPPSLESEVLNSTDPMFSDRLSMFFCYTTLADLLAVLSWSKITSLRKDVFFNFTQQTSEVLLLLKDAVDLMLERNWYDEMPKNIDRNDIIHKS